MGCSFHQIIPAAGLLALFLAPELRAGTSAVGLTSGVSILENWQVDQHVYTVGELGPDAEKLAELEKWIDGNAPNWTVLLMESSGGERYRDAEGGEHRGIDAVENAMGKGLPTSTAFGGLNDPATGLANGAFFILFLKDRKFSFYGDKAYQRFQLGAAQWQGDLDQAAIAAMRNGGRVVDAARDTIQSVDGRFRRAVVSEEERTVKNLQKASGEMEKVQALMGLAEREFLGFWTKLERRGGGRFALSPLEEWQGDLERVAGYQRDGDTMAQLGGLLRLEKRIRQWREDFQSFLRDEARLKSLRETVQQKSASGVHQPEDLKLIQEVMGNAEKAYYEGDPQYLLAMREVGTGIANLRLQEEEARSRQKMAGAAGAVGTGFLGLMGFVGNRRRRRIKLEAETLLEKRKAEMSEMSDRLFAMMDRAAIIVGPFNELEARGYTGETLKLSCRALQEIDEAFVLSSNVRRIIEEAVSLMEPATPLGKSKNMVSGGCYEQAVDLLDAEVRAEAQEVPDLEERVRPGGKSDAVFTMPLDEWKGRTMDALDRAEADLNEVDEAWTTIVSRREKIEAALAKILEDWREPADGWLECAATFEVWIPAIREAVVAGSLMGRSDPVSALRGPLGEGERMVAEARRLLDLISRFRRDHWAALEEGEQLLDSRGRATVWVDQPLVDLSLQCDEIAAKGCGTTVARDLENLTQAFSGFVERVTASAGLSERAELSGRPSMKSAGSVVERVRRELASVLGLERDRILIEEGRNPSIYLDEARLQFDGALAALDLGEAIPAEGFLNEVAALVSRALGFVEETKRSHADYPEASEELWRRRGDLEDLAKKAKKDVELMQSRYASPALFVEVGADEGDSYAGAPVLLEGFLVKIVQCLDRAKSAMTGGSLLESWSLIEEGRDLAGAGEMLSRDIKERLADLGELETSNREALAARIREKDDLNQLVQDRRVMEDTRVEFGNLEMRVQEAIALVSMAEGRIDPYSAHDLLEEIEERVPAMREAIADDLEEHAGAGRLLETVRLALESAARLCETSRTDRIPDSHSTTDALRQIESRRRDWEEVSMALEVAHGDWRRLQEQLRTIHLGLSEGVMSLQKELKLARQAVRFLQSGAEEVARAAGWSGRFGVRVNGRPGGDALDQGNQLILNGSYQEAMKWAGRAQAEARSAIASAEAEESARAQAEERRRAKRAREARQPLMRHQGMGVTGGNQSSPGFGRGASFGSSSFSRHSGGTSVGRSSFSSGSGVGRSGW